MNYTRRCKEVIRSIKKAGIQALLVSNPVNVFYLTGFKSSNVFLMLTGDEVTVFTDFRYEQAAKKLCEDQKLNCIILKKGFAYALKNYCLKNNVKQIAFEDDNLIVATYNSLKKTVAKVKWIPAKTWINNVRKIKEPAEIDVIKKAIFVAEKGFLAIKPKQWIGLTEIDAAELLEEKIKSMAKKAGLHAVVSFDFIVAAGANATVPHHAPDKTVIKKGDMLKIDWGAKVDDYCSDMTRTLFLGEPTARFKKIYKIVLQANRAAIKAVRPGVTFKTIDTAARNIIKKAGFGDNFGHGTGHGVGLEVHEKPVVSQLSKERVSSGMIFSVEPGIYIPGWGGIRIEDMVLATPKGGKVLTSLPK